MLICCDNLMGTHTTRHLPIFENQFELIYNCDERLICTSFLSRSRIEPTQPKQAEQLIYRIARLSCFCVFVLFLLLLLITALVDGNAMTMEYLYIFLARSQHPTSNTHYIRIAMCLLEYLLTNPRRKVYRNMLTTTNNDKEHRIIIFELRSICYTFY